MQRLKRRVLAAAGVLLTAGAFTLTSVAEAAAGAAQPGAPGIGDSLFPGLGNGGYDAKSYKLRLRYPALAPAEAVQGVVRMDAKATQDLSAFNVDYGGDAIGSVKVNDRPARFEWQQASEELVITPPQPIRNGQSFSTVVEFTSHATVPAEDNLFAVGWVATPDGTTFTSFQPDMAHDAIPVNDHPSDKATWKFELDVPRGATAIANGIAAGQHNTADRTVWRYDECSPLATELIQLAVSNDFSIVQRGTVSGVTYRDVIANSRQDLFEPAFKQGPAQLQWMIDKIGKFPHRVYGNLGINHRFGYALETQGISLHSEGLFNPDFIPGRTGEEWFYSSVMAHEEAHEWYGNSVSPLRWSDLWLNEGWATLFMKLWEEEQGTIDEWGNPSLVDYMRETYALGDAWRAEYGPVARPSSAETLFSPNVYDGGALALFALWQKVGDAKFMDILTGWPREFKNTSRSTDDFIKYASKRSGQNLTEFLGAWLYGNQTPPMPNYPDWTVDPVDTAAAASTADRVTFSGPHGWLHHHEAHPALVGAK